MAIVFILISVISCDRNMICHSNEMENDSMEQGTRSSNYLQEVNALQYGNAESSLNANHRQDLVLTNKRYQDENVSKSITYSIENTACDFSYIESYDSWQYYVDYHIYEGKYNGHIAELMIDSITGECISFLRFPATDDNPDTACSLEQKFDVAYAFLLDNVDDPQNYTWIPDKSISPNYFYFVRLVGEIETNDYLKVAVDDAGGVYSYFKSNLGEMKNIGIIPKDVLQKVYEELQNECQGIYRVLEEDECVWENQIGITQLVKLEDGSLALDCWIDVSVTYDNGINVSDGAWFIIPITEPTA